MNKGDVTKDKEILPILQQIGWKCGKDEAGDYHCWIENDGRQVQVIPFIGKRFDHYRVSLMPSVSTKAFSAAVAQIFGRSNGHEPITVSNFGVEKIPGVPKEDVIRIAQDALAWASAQDVEAGLAAYRALPTDAKGAMPLRHLASLVLAGDVERLQSYRRSLDKGDRLGFVPYITTDMIERAISIAQEGP